MTPFGHHYDTILTPGVLKFSVKYGDSPNLLLPGLPLLEYRPVSRHYHHHHHHHHHYHHHHHHYHHHQDFTELPYDWIVTLEVPSPGYNANATIQVQEKNIFPPAAHLLSSLPRVQPLYTTTLTPP
jgi:G3E family GTPase